MLTVPYAECHTKAPYAQLLMLNFVMLSVIILSVVAPFYCYERRHAECHFPKCRGALS
jgi:hypothetical protein